MLLAEANQWPADVRAYFGDGDECHMAFHFPLMPRLFMALRQEDRHPISEILYQMPKIPDICQWAIFLRNHDELTLEMVSDEERDYMYQAYAADPRMRLNAGIRRRLAPLMENSRPTHRAADRAAVLASRHAGPLLRRRDRDGRQRVSRRSQRRAHADAVECRPQRRLFARGPARLYAPLIMDSVYGYRAVNVEAQDRSPHSLLAWMRRIIALRQRHVARSAVERSNCCGRQTVASSRSSAGSTDETVLVVANLSRTVQPAELDLSAFDEPGRR